MGCGEWRFTEDGSLSWFDQVVGELQHNRAGAYAESMVQYVEPLCERYDPAKRVWRWLDACFGLGYNTWSLLQALLGPTLVSSFAAPHCPYALDIWAVELDPQILSFCEQILTQPIYEDLKAILDTSAHNICYLTSSIFAKLC